MVKGIGCSGMVSDVCANGPTITIAESPKPSFFLVFLANSLDHGPCVGNSEGNSDLFHLRCGNIHNTVNLKFDL